MSQTGLREADLKGEEEEMPFLSILFRPSFVASAMGSSTGHWLSGWMDHNGFLPSEHRHSFWILFPPETQREREERKARKPQKSSLTAVCSFVAKLRMQPYVFLWLSFAGCSVRAVVKSGFTSDDLPNL